ncbi:MAG: hypothetical protein J0H75_16545, partial [Rhizobiales bacterium]|nr:hypothetical protein [Hyphomicrobiales bacterium]
MTGMMPDGRGVWQLGLAAVAGLACAAVIAKALPTTMDAVSNVLAPLCAVSDAGASSPLDKVEVIASHA